jgi:hypothetical protein
MAGAACSTVPGATARNAAVNHDRLVGWFKAPDCDHRRRVIVPGRERVIPIFKVHGKYYTFLGGAEVELRECANGLEFVSEDNSDVVTELAFDSTGQPYAVLNGKRLITPQGHSVEGLRLPMTPIEQPSWAVMPSPAPQPHSANDFVGFYCMSWCTTDSILEIRKEGDRYFLSFNHDADGQWKTDGQPLEMTPKPDGTGFYQGKDSSDGALIYNKSRKRYQLDLSALIHTAVIPLERLEKLPSSRPMQPPENVELGIGVYK